jgi:hypothetical protein
MASRAVQGSYLAGRQVLGVVDHADAPDIDGGRLVARHHRDAVDLLSLQLVHDAAQQRRAADRKHPLGPVLGHGLEPLSAGRRKDHRRGVLPPRRQVAAFSLDQLLRPLQAEDLGDGGDAVLDISHAGRGADLPRRGRHGRNGGADHVVRPDHHAHTGLAKDLIRRAVIFRGYDDEGQPSPPFAGERQHLLGPRALAVDEHGIGSRPPVRLGTAQRFFEPPSRR